MLSDGHERSERLPELSVNSAIASLIEEVVGAIGSNRAIDSGDLLGACLLDPHVSELVASWGQRALDPSEVLEWVKPRVNESATEGSVQVWSCCGHRFRLTTLTSFVLRFLHTCGSESEQVLILIAGLAELAPPPVQALLDHLGIPLPDLCRSLKARGLQMHPLLEDIDDHWRRQALIRFKLWLVDVDEFEDWLKSLGDSPLQVSLLLNWLEDTHDENPAITRTPQLGDIVVFSVGGLKDICILDTGGRWRSLTHDSNFEQLVSAGFATRAFRARSWQR